MAYNRKNLLEKIIQVQDITLKYRKEGVTFIYIYETYIRRTYRISYSTYNNWLGIPAKAELRELDKENNL